VARSEVDGQYYEVAKPGSVSERLLIVARDRIYADFLRLMAPGAQDDILDVGVSDVVGPGANLLERLYPRPERLTAVGLGEGVAFRAEYPAIAYRQITPGQALPFADKTFAIACSNAVLEHVGSTAAQLAFVTELRRVARRVFITVPHRFFPVEHHTGVPLLHYTDATFALACRLLGKTFWSRPENLILMSRRRLASLCPTDSEPLIGRTGLMLGPFSSNLFLALGGRG
jgi:hypothetical protein